jgi:hypothetical protein
MAFGAVSSGMPGSMAVGASTGMISAPGMLMLGGNNRGGGANLARGGLPGSAGQGGSMNQMMQGGGMSGPMSGLMGPGAGMRSVAPPSHLPGGNWGGPGASGPGGAGQRSGSAASHMLPVGNMFQDGTGGGGNWGGAQQHLPGAGAFGLPPTSGGYGGRVMGGGPGMR